MDENVAEEFDDAPEEDGCIGGRPFQTLDWFNADNPMLAIEWPDGSVFGGIDITPDPDRPIYSRNGYYPPHNNWIIHWFGRAHRFEKFLNAMRNDPHDPRWSCIQWPGFVAAFAREIVNSYAADIGIDGAPSIVLQRYQSNVVHMVWRTPSGGGVVCDLPDVDTLRMCDECDPCLIRRGIVAPKGSHLSIVRSAPLVYFVQADTGGPVKIGRSMSPTERLPSLQTGNPNMLRILATMPGGAVVETSMHALFAKERVRPNGEWFHPSPELLGFIAEIAAHEK